MTQQETMLVTRYARQLERTILVPFMDGLGRKPFRILTPSLLEAFPLLSGSSHEDYLGTCSPSTVQSTFDPCMPNTESLAGEEETPTSGWVG